MFKQVLVLLSFAATVVVPSHAPAELIFSENVGTPSSTTLINSYTGWQNNGVLTFTGLGDVRTTSPSNVYSGASGSGNVFLTNDSTSRFLEISGINTLGFVPGTFDLSFGAFKSTIASNMSELSLEYSSDGSNYTALSIPLQPTGSGTTNWRLIELSDLGLPTVMNLRLRWTNTSSTSPQFRLDDISLSAVPEPTSLVLFGTLIGLLSLRRRRSA